LKYLFKENLSTVTALVNKKTTNGGAVDKFSLPLYVKSCAQHRIGLWDKPSGEGDRKRG